MVDFKKKLAVKKVKSPVEPIELYNSLDRAVDKGPLRPAQAAVLKEWHEGYRSQRDVIVKLHTGQGKTLIGLLILQSRLNDGKGPALYLCPNRFPCGANAEAGGAVWDSDLHRGSRSTGRLYRREVDTCHLSSEAIQWADEIWASHWMHAG